MSVPCCSGSKYRASLIILITWLNPFRGGTNFSILSVNAIRPTLSLFFIADMARREQTSAASCLLSLFTVPKYDEPDISSRSIMVSSLSSTNFLTKGWPVRAVTFQSIERMSSPGWYSLTSSNSIPMPLNTLW